jgi:hypothetical protein
LEEIISTLKKRQSSEPEARIKGAEVRLLRCLAHDIPFTQSFT